MKRHLFVLLAAILLVLPLHAHSMIRPTTARAHEPALYRFAPVLVKTGTLAPGAMGLPGEQITWTITLTNQGTGAGTDIAITDVVRDDLRIDRVENVGGTFTISGQSVLLTFPRIEPGQTIEMRIMTTVLHSPADGLLLNQATLTALGPDGPVNDSASAEVSVPATLPATGYAEPLPGDDEPPLWIFALGSAVVVGAAAFIVWRRGSLHGLGRR